MEASGKMLHQALLSRYSICGATKYRNLCTLCGYPTTLRGLFCDSLSISLMQGLFSLIPSSKKLQEGNSTLQMRKLCVFASMQHGCSSKNNSKVQDTGQKHKTSSIKVKKVPSKHTGKKSKASQIELSEWNGTHENELKQKPTIFVFDIETTGFSPTKERIIEFACKDLAGGKFSTLQSLVNPCIPVRNSYVHKITTEMVNRSDVPRWKDLAPILIRYVNCRQNPGSNVIWVAHCARFDAKFLAHEFHRCSIEIPRDWVFVDSLELARQIHLPDGTKLSTRKLEDLRQHYNIPSMGASHRAMVDVNTLALVLQKLTFDLKMPVSGLLSRSFKVKC